MVKNKILESMIAVLLCFFAVQNATAQCDFIDSKTGHRYTGECKTKIVDGKEIKYPEGKGTQINSNGSSFAGTFLNGQRVSGTYYFDNNNRNGSRIENAVYEDDVLKSGIWIFKNGAKYEGTFKDDKFDGEGVFFYKPDSNKIRYEGAFAGGKFNGEGTLYYRDSTFQKGQWKDDEFQGMLIGYLKGVPAYWDAINTVTIGEKIYKKDEQKIDSITGAKSTGSHNASESAITTTTQYFYIKNNNIIIGVVKFEESITGLPAKILDSKVSLDTDQTLLNHLNRNQHNKPAKLPLTHWKDRWYYDANKCFWYLYERRSSIYHNPPGKYINIKLVRLDANKRESHETVLNVSENIAQQIDEDNFPTTITGNMVKTGKYRQTFNFHHCKDFSWSVDYFKDLFDNVSDYTAGHKKYDVDLHEAGWIHYAEFPQDTYAEATDEEKQKLQDCSFELMKLNEYVKSVPVEPVISAPKRSAAPGISEIVTLINETCHETLVEHLKTYPLNFFSLLARRNTITESSEKAILRIMNCMPSQKYSVFLNCLEANNNMIMKYLVDELNDKTIRIFGENSYTNFIKELIRIYREVPDFWDTRLSKVGESKLLGQIINLNPMPFESDMKIPSASSFYKEFSLNEFRFTGVYNESTGTISVYREQRIWYENLKTDRHGEMWRADQEAVASNLKPLDPIIIATDKELPIVQTALKKGELTSRVYIVPAIFFKYREQKKSNQTLFDALVDMGAIAFDIASIYGTGATLQLIKASTNLPKAVVWARRVWAWAGILGSTGNIAIKTDVIKNEKVKQTIEIYNNIFFSLSVSGNLHHLQD
ncbi:MAG: hypothetical protein LBP85_00385 [Prevotellaceae bacterium]|nr:hypothetical protein [Prevotellaceae bacterium]